METRSRMSRSLHTNRDFEKLEPYEGKPSRTVLRGEEGSNALDLPDKYYRQDIAGIFGTAETDEDTDGTGKEPGQPGEPYTVMGESTYLPFGAEDGEEAAAGAVDEPAAEDDGADYSDIEPEEDEEETDYEPTPEEIRELEEEEELGAYYPDGNPDFATGYSFDDLKKVRRVLVSDNADEKAEREAREVLPSVMGSDIWEAMLDEFEGARERVARLMDNHNV